MIYYFVIVQDSIHIKRKHDILSHNLQKFYTYKIQQK